MSATKTFHLGDILSITHNRVLSPGYIDGMAGILNWMTGETLMRHQLSRAARECRQPLLSQHPDLAVITVPGGLGSRDKVVTWLATLYSAYGETREVAPLAPGDHTFIDPFTEMRMIRPDVQAIAVVVPDGMPGGAA